MNAKESRETQKTIYRLEKLLKVGGRNPILEEALSEARFKLSLLAVICDNCHDEFEVSRFGKLTETCHKCNLVMAQKRFIAKGQDDLNIQEIVIISLSLRGETVDKNEVFYDLIKRGYLDTIDGNTYVTRRGVRAFAHFKTKQQKGNTTNE